MLKVYLMLKSGDVLLYFLETNLYYNYYVYSGTSLIRTPLGQTKVSLIERCP